VSSPDGARLLERLLEDPGFRARFRSNPVAAAREAGFGDLADELAGGERPLQTLEIRESRSSVAGMMLAAAAEGVGLFELSEHVLPHVGAEDALADTKPPEPAPEDLGDVETAAPASDTPDSDDQESDDQESDDQESDGPGSDDDDQDEPDEEEPDEDKPDEDEDGDDSDDSDDSDDDSDDDDNPDETGSGPGEAAPQTSGNWKPDPEQYGMASGGGPKSPIDAAVLHNSRITLDANGKQDFAKGRMDPRLGAVLLRLAEKHELTLSATTSDHPQSTAGGSPSNHWYGRGVDIATVDGEIVRPDSAASRKLAAELTRLDAAIRPDEVGSPWSIAAPGFFTDASHQNHIHVAFDHVIDPKWKPPNDARVMPALRPDQVDKSD
jgi:hypothetical protein